jgi:PmbA protein
MNKSLAEKILSLAKAQNADAAEVFIRSRTSLSVEVKDQKVDAFDRAHDVGAGLRVLSSGRIGFAFTTDFSDAALDALARAASTNAELVAPDQYHSLPAKPAAALASPKIFDPAFSRLSEREKIERAMALERATFAVDPRIKRIRKASVGFGETETLIMNSNGAEVAYAGTICSSSVEAVAEQGSESQAGSEFDVSRFYGLLRVEDVGRVAAQRALDLLGARHIDTVRAPIILEAPVALDFLSLMASGFSAESVQKKRSLFMGRLGQDVASPLITVIDDGLREGGLGTMPADDEAVPTQKKILIGKGRLERYLYNTYSANKDGVESTGNGMRGGFSALPGTGVTNLSLLPGTYTFDELLASIDRGLLVTDVMGMHTANAISGDFSVGATGFWIEKGKKAFPVREITIAGNILDCMRDVDAVGSDLRFSGRIGSPSLRIREMSISGK